MYQSVGTATFDRVVSTGTIALTVTVALVTWEALRLRSLFLHRDELEGYRQTVAFITDFAMEETPAGSLEGAGLMGILGANRFVQTLKARALPDGAPSPPKARRMTSKQMGILLDYSNSPELVRKGGIIADLAAKQRQASSDALEIYSAASSSVDLSGLQLAVAEEEVVVKYVHALSLPMATPDALQARSEAEASGSGTDGKYSVLAAARRNFNTRRMSVNPFGLGKPVAGHDAIPLTELRDGSMNARLTSELSSGSSLRDTLSSAFVDPEHRRNSLATMRNGVQSLITQQRVLSRLARTEMELSRTQGNIVRNLARGISVDLGTDGTSPSRAGGLPAAMGLPPPACLRATVEVEASECLSSRALSWEAPPLEAAGSSPTNRLNPPGRRERRTSGSAYKREHVTNALMRGTSRAQESDEQDEVLELKIEHLKKRLGITDDKARSLVATHACRGTTSLSKAPFRQDRNATRLGKETGMSVDSAKQLLAMATADYRNSSSRRSEPQSPRPMVAFKPSAVVAKEPAEDAKSAQTVGHQVTEAAQAAGRKVAAVEQHFSAAGRNLADKWRNLFDGHGTAAGDAGAASRAEQFAPPQLEPPSEQQPEERQEPHRRQVEDTQQEQTSMDHPASPSVTAPPLLLESPAEAAAPRGGVESEKAPLIAPGESSESLAHLYTA